MKIRFRTFALAALFVLPLIGLQAHAQQAEGLQQRMSAVDFRAAGLDKLSPQELAHLEAWLAAHPVVKTRMVSSSGKPVFYADNTKRQKIDTHIQGHFGGWQGQSQFTLDNGQVWKQAGSDVPECMSSDHPKVKLKPSLFGSWLMYVDGCNGDAHVERVH